MGLGALQPGHLIVVLVIVLLIFGPGKLPQLGKAVGDGLRELKKSTTGEDSAPSGTSSSTVTVTPITPIAVATLPAAHVCASCRTSMAAGDRFCGNCGASAEPIARSA